VRTDAGCALPAALPQAYGIDGKLHVSYALTPAWG
jgi:hypothetical protein